MCVCVPIRVRVRYKELIGSVEESGVSLVRVCEHLHQGKKHTFKSEEEEDRDGSSGSRLSGDGQKRSLLGLLGGEDHEIELIFTDKVLPDTLHL